MRLNTSYANPFADAYERSRACGVRRSSVSIAAGLQVFVTPDECKKALPAESDIDCLTETIDSLQSSPG